VPVEVASVFASGVESLVAGEVFAWVELPASEEGQRVELAWA